MARRKDHTREELHEMILDASEAIVAQDGLRALTTRRVAAAIGYAPGTIYNVFGDADALISELNLRTLRKLNAVLDAVALGEDAMANARSMLGDYLRFTSENAQLWDANVTHSQRQDIHQPEAYDAELARSIERVAQAIDPSGAAPDARLAVRVLWAALSGIAKVPPSSRMLQTMGVTVEDLAENLVETYLRGWTAKGG